MTFAALTSLEAGMRLVVGDRLFIVSPEMARAFKPGDRLMPVEETLEVLIVTAEAQRAARDAVDRAVVAFRELAKVSDAAITQMFEVLAKKIEDDSIWRAVAAANEADVASAEARGRSTTRLRVSAPMRSGMAEGLRTWAASTTRRDQVLETIEHDDWQAELVSSPLGVVAFVFEGRPNVIVDAIGVLRGGNSVVFRIGRDALRTAEALMDLAVRPALRESGLPENAVSLVRDASHASGWALFSDPRVGLAVARGSGHAVQVLGSLARRAGVSVSCHGTGGAWLFASTSASTESFEAAVKRSLDRKVCNTMNVCSIPPSRAEELVPAFLRAIEAAGGEHGFRLHVAAGSEAHVPSELFARKIEIHRANGKSMEPQADTLELEDLGLEWEWEMSPEVTLLVADLPEAVELCNRRSPKFVASLISDRDAEHAWFYQATDAPFIGDGHTRWVDGQFCLRKPELGLSNWQFGRLMGRGGILTGDGVYTVRTRSVSKKRRKR